jgi:4-alpha-glucanotransferase
MTGVSAKLRAAARACGIAPSYRDYKGDQIWIAAKTLTAMIALLQDTPEEAVSPENILRKSRTERLARGLPPVIIAWDETLPATWFWSEDVPGRLGLTLEEDGGEIRRRWSCEPENIITRRIGGKSYYRVKLDAHGKIPFGYYLLKIEGRGTSALVISAPRHLAPPDKSWGLFAPVYALTSGHKKDIGDYALLARASAFIRRAGGGFIGTLPLLPVFYEGDKADASPYSPVSRLFWNEIFLDTGENPQDDGGNLIDYPAVYARKRKIIQEKADRFFAENPDGGAGFKAYRSDNPPLPAYAAFRAKERPENEREAAIRYHLYAQYECHRQLSDLKTKADAGNAAEIYMDYTVGVNPHGFDAEIFPHLFLKGAFAGAPPDEYFSQGQNWGFYPFHLQKLYEDRFSYLRAALSHYFRYARIIRLDHVMGFYRIWCVPHGMRADQGVYLYRSFEAMLAVLCLEAWRHGGVLIGENLGTVPAFVNESLAEHGIHRMWLCQFEMKDNPARSFDSITPYMIASLNTHDLYPFEAFLKGDDIRELKKRNLLSEAGSEALAARRENILRLWRGKSDAFSDCLKGMAASPAHYVMISLEDFWRETQPQNIPGTSGGENWRRKFALPIEEWADFPSLKAGIDILNRCRKEGRPE